MKIFLSGKVDEKHGKWRDAILGVSTIYNEVTRCVDSIPRWVLRVSRPDYDTCGIARWTELTRVIMDTHDYVGPYRQVLLPDGDKGNKNTGYFHGVESNGSHGTMDEDDRRVVVDRCKEAIRQADMVFAYINSPDCFGTVAELGYAVGLGKFVSVVVSPEACWEWDDFWFVGDMANMDAQLWEVCQDEGAWLRSALLESISKRSAWTPPADSLLKQAASAFYSIQKWTADPRVRDEAAKMLSQLHRSSYERS